MRWNRYVIAALGVAGSCAVALAEPMPVFGPQTFELTTAEVETFTEEVEVDRGGPHVLYLRNGDSAGSRVSSAMVRVNGVAVVQSADLDDDRAGLVRPVPLREGSNTLAVEIAGAPGAFVTLAIGEPDRPPTFISGRLLLPWGRHDDGVALALALKNGSAHAPRAVRVVFYGPGGHVLGASERLTLPPRASLVASVDELLAQGSWQAGSIEVFYAGPGRARLFGSARQIERTTGRWEAEPLQQAGSHAFPGLADAPHPRPRPAR